MSSPLPLTPVDPSVSPSPDQTAGPWNPQPQPPSGFPPEVPRHPPDHPPEWSPLDPQEVPLPKPTPMPDWSPSSSTDPTAIDDPEFPTKHDSPARPDGKHDLGDTPDERHGPIVIEDPTPEPHPADEGGDIEEPGSQNPTAIVAAHPEAAPQQLTPSGRPMRPTTQEAFY